MPELFAEGYLEEDLIPSNLNRRLFICVDKGQLIAKTNISTSTNKNYTILLDDTQRMQENMYFNEIYLVGATFDEIHQDTLEELKLLCYEVWTISDEDFNIENILKNFTNKN